MIEVPKIFQVETNHEYPPYNKMVFEEYFMNYYMDNNIETERIYLPIMWTNFYINRKYASLSMQDLQDFLDKLDTTKKYFTVILWDDGILQNVDHLDIKIFGGGGGGKNTKSIFNLGYPIPLLCSPSPCIDVHRKKDLLYSFVGTIKEMYPIRTKLKKLYSNKFPIKDRTSYGNFIDIMERSVFSLCPRGYGATSFRICEALQHGSIPVYIYDRPWIPWEGEFDFNQIGILLPESEICNVFNILSRKSKRNISDYLRKGKHIYNKYSTFEGASKQIIKKLCQ